MRKRRSNAATQRRSADRPAALGQERWGARMKERGEMQILQLAHRVCSASDHFITLSRYHLRARRRALTLVELMVVIVILGILATTVTISVRDYLVTGKQNAAKQELAQIVAALDLFYMEHDRYPTNEEGLAVLMAKSDKHPDGLLRGGDLNDPWGHPYQYVCPGVHGSFDLVCYGVDGLEGGTGADSDINSWDLK